MTDSGRVSSVVSHATGKAPQRLARRVADATWPPTTAMITNRLTGLLDSIEGIRELAVEIGLVDEQWFSHPLSSRPPVSPPLEVLRRFVETVVERHPSVLASIGLRAVELLAWDAFWDRRQGLRPAHAATSRAVVVFTDLEGFTAFTAEVGDQQARRVLAEHYGACRPIIRRAGGRVVKRLGDGLMVVFDDASAALHVAVELLDTAPDPLRVRVGLHAGDVEVTADDLIGQVVNIAARVADAAAADQVLATAEVVAASGNASEVRVGAPHTLDLRGIDRPVVAHQVGAGRPGR